MEKYKFIITDKDGNTIIGYKGKEYLEPSFVYAPYIPINVAIMVNGRMVWHRSRWMRIWISIKDIFRKKIITDKILTKYSKKEVNTNYYSKIMSKK